MIATKFERPFVTTNKTDADDASAIWEAAQRPGMRFVPVKSEQQQGILALHNMRDLLVKSRTAQIHQIRAVFTNTALTCPAAGIGGSRRCRRHLHEVKVGWRRGFWKRSAPSSHSFTI